VICGLKKIDFDNIQEEYNVQLCTVVSCHQLLVRRYTTEQVAATNLELRIRFKKQLHVRNTHLPISKKDQVRICGFAYL
jgi:hypothetical protein